MNSVIGKTAARGWRWQDDGSAGPPGDWSLWYGDDPTTGDSCRWRSIAMHGQREVCTGEHPESCPQLAAWVYSLARVRLWEWMETAGRENVYYVDTDSIFCNALGHARLCNAGAIQPGEMGALRLQAVHDWLTVYGVKAYQTPHKTTLAGAPTDCGLRTLGGYEFWTGESVKDSVRAVPHGHAPRPLERRYTMPLHRPYRHGIVHPDGTITPLEV